MAARLTLFLLLLTLAACENTRGVQRTVTLTQRVPGSAVVAAVQALPDVQLVKARHLTPTNGYGIVQFRNRSTDQFQYVSASRHADGVIEIGGNDREGLRLRIYCLWQNSNPSAEQIGATRQLMDEIYASLRRQLPYLPAPERVQEDLMGVNGS